MAEVHIQALAVTEVWVSATAVEHNLRHTLLNDLEVLRPESQLSQKRKLDSGKDIHNFIQINYILLNGCVCLFKSSYLDRFRCERS